MTGPPLRRLRVVITRATHQAGRLVEAFTVAGAEVLHLPLLEVVPVKGPDLLRAAAQAGSHKAWVFTSSNAVEAFLPLLPDKVFPAQIAAVGPATASALRRHGFAPHFVAQRSRAEGLLAELLPHLAPGDRVLLPQAEDARPDLAKGLQRAGVEVTTIVSYRKRLPKAAADQARSLFADHPLGWVTFTSPRIVRHFVDLLGNDWQDRRSELHAVSIGPVTSHELRKFNVEPRAEARRPEPAALVDAVVDSVVGAAVGAVGAMVSGQPLEPRLGEPESQSDSD